MTAAEYRALNSPKVSQRSSPPHERPQAGISTPPAPPDATQGKKPGVRWQAATGLHKEQFPATFRIVCEGPREEQEAFEHHLSQYQSPKQQ